MTNKTVDHIVHELEDQFHHLQDKIAKAKDDYVKKHDKEYTQALKRVEATKKKFNSSKKKAAKAAIDMKEKGSKAASIQLQKAKAAMILIGESLGEAKDILMTAENNLKSAKPLEKKLAARARALAAFERDWAKKEKEAEKKKLQQAKARKKKAAEAKKAKVKKTVSVSPEL